mgnify:CR=1 FL=1
MKINNVEKIMSSGGPETPRLDMNQFIKDSESDEIAKQIDLEIEQLRTSGIPRLAVPKFLIQGKEPQGRSLDKFSAMIEQELKLID